MSRIQNKKIGSIGAGNMGSAIITRLSKKIPKDNITIYDIDTDKSNSISKKCKINSSSSIESLVKKSEIIILAVKPDTVNSILEQIKKSIDNHIIISIAAGISISSIEKIIGPSHKIIRVMPNTPAVIGEGMSVLCPNKNVDDEILEIVEEIFSQIGKVLVLQEKLMDAVTGISGSGPAYVFTFIQAMADGGVKMGIPRDKSLILAAQTVLGASKMILAGKDSPILLRDRVASPGGTTIDAIHSLERSGFSGIVIDAVETATKKSKILGENNV